MGDAISAHTELTTPASDDEFILNDKDVSTTKKITHDNLFSVIKRIRTDIKAVTDDTVIFDFDDNEEITDTLTGNPTFTTSNRAKGKHKIIHLDGGASDRTFSLPAWIFYGTKPTKITANKKGVLSLTCLGTTEALVRAVFVEEA